MAKVIRILEYKGSEEWIMRTLANSYTRYKKTFSKNGEDSSIEEIYCEVITSQGREVLINKEDNVYKPEEPKDG